MFVYLSSKSDNPAIMGYNNHIKTMIEEVLKTLGIEGGAQRIYLDLLESGSASARMISQRLSIPRPTVYDGLNDLMNHGLVVSKSEDTKTIFGASDPDNLLQLLDQQTAVIEHDKKLLKEILPSLKKKAKTVEPQIRFFAGKEGIQKIFNDVLWYKNIETYSLWPTHKMMAILGAEYLEWHNKRRVANNTTLKALRRHGAKLNFSKYPFMANRKEDLRELRYAPKSMHFEISYWIYADKVAFVSASEKPFGFIVHSEEFAELVLMHFKIIWAMSK